MILGTRQDGEREGADEGADRGFVKNGAMASPVRVTTEGGDMFAKPANDLVFVELKYGENSKDTRVVWDPKKVKYEVSWPSLTDKYYALISVNDLNEAKQAGSACPADNPVLAAALTGLIVKRNPDTNRLEEYLPDGVLNGAVESPEQAPGRLRRAINRALQLTGLSPTP
jgi:hypothetical protein